MSFLFSCLFSRKRERKHGVGRVGKWENIEGDEGNEIMFIINYIKCIFNIKQTLLWEKLSKSKINTIMND